MQTDTITLTCTDVSGGFTCTTPAIFSGGEMFISLMLFIGLILAIISMLRAGVFSVSVNKKYLGVNQIEGKEIYKI